LKTLTLASAAVLSCAGLLLGGCAVKEEKRPAENFPSISVSPESATPVETADGDAVTVVDVSPGGPEDSDPLWQGLAKSAKDKKPIYLSTWIHYDSKIPKSGQVTLTADTPESVSVTTDAKAVTSTDAPFYHVVGTFDIDQAADSAFTLKQTSGEEKKNLNPKSPDTKARCTAADAGDRLQKAAQDLAEDPGKRDEMRLQWGGSPQVWWAIQRTAQSLRDSHGDSQGDFFTEACEKYLQAG